MASQITVTGNCTDPSGTGLDNGVNSNAFVRFILRNFQGSIPQIQGTAIVAETQIDCVPGASGAFSQALWPNNLITPPTVYSTEYSTFYTVQYWSNGRITSQGNYIFTANTNLNTAQQLNPAPTQAYEGIVFENDGAMNSSQQLLNLTAGSGITITDEGGGDIQIATSSSGGINQVSVNLNAAQVLALQNFTGEGYTPITLLPAPGAGLFYDVVRVVYSQYVPSGGTGFTDCEIYVGLAYDTSNDNTLAWAVNVLPSSSSSQIDCYPATAIHSANISGLTGTSFFVNQPVILFGQSSTGASGGTGGTTVNVTVYYTVNSMA